MANILYGAPESEHEEQNSLVAKLWGEHDIAYFNDFLGFAFELTLCREIPLLRIERQYDVIVYDTKSYGESWRPDVRAECFEINMMPFFRKVAVPVIVLADEQIKDEISDLVRVKGLFYLPSPYTIEEAVETINSALMGEKPKYGKLK